MTKTCRVKYDTWEIMLKLFFTFLPFFLELFLHFQNLKNRCQLPRLPCLIYIIYLPYELLKYLIDLELMPNRDFPITLNSQNSLFLTVVFALLLNLKRLNNWYWYYNYSATTYKIWHFWVQKLISPMSIWKGIFWVP